LITQPLPQSVLDRAGETFDVEAWLNARAMSQEELIARAQDKDALLITLLDKMTAAVFEKLPASVKIVATYSVGYDHIDIPAAKAQGIVVTNTPDAVTIATAEIAVLLILGAARRAGEGERLLRSGQWVGWSPTLLLGRRLDGKRLGIFG